MEQNVQRRGQCVLQEQHSGTLPGKRGNHASPARRCAAAVVRGAVPGVGGAGLRRSGLPPCWLWYAKGYR